jgi:hypothetical protein
LERPPALFLKNFSQFGRLSRFYRLNNRASPSSSSVGVRDRPRLPLSIRAPVLIGLLTPRLQGFPASTLASERVVSLFSPQKNAPNVATGATGKTLSKTLLILFFSHSDDFSKVKKRNGASASPSAV